MTTSKQTKQNPVDPLMETIADYVCDATVGSDLALDTARDCLMDSLACGLMALDHPRCTRLLGAVVPGAHMSHGARVFGTAMELDPVQSAFNIGVMIRWLDFNDTWLAAEWGHPSDNLGGILACADYLSRCTDDQQRRSVTVHEVLIAMIKAYEIQGVLALHNSFNRVGLDHVLLVRVATTAVVAKMLGASRKQLINALSNAWIDGGALRTYRHAPNTGSRKSWAAGDATARAVWHALMALRGEMGYPSALSAPIWGFEHVLFNGRSLKLARPLGEYVMENILFKIAYPAEFHAQTAVEAAIQLHPQVRDRIAAIQIIKLETQQAGVRIIDKTGPLDNPADRDHCLQYMVAVALLFGDLTAKDYQQERAADIRIDSLRAKMQVSENEQYSRAYLDPDLRSIANAVQVFFDDGDCTDRVEVHFPLGHRRRRTEARPLLWEKFSNALDGLLDSHARQSLLSLFEDRSRLQQTRLSDLIDLLLPSG